MIQKQCGMRNIKPSSRTGFRKNALASVNAEGGNTAFFMRFQAGDKNGAEAQN
jgi:hypothetical protein